MKKIKNLVILSAVLLSMIICFDDSFALFLNLDTSEIPFQSDSSRIIHHHHPSLSDHFFQINSYTDLTIDFAAGYQLFLKSQSFADQFHSSIWQPPKKLLVS